MIFRKHFELEGKHSTLSASKPAWLNYSDERMFEFVDNLQAARRGSELHEYARQAIRLNRKQPDTSQTINMYINDAIGYRMKPEQTLFYSIRAFATADAVGFDEETQTLRIFDLKNGVRKAAETQLEIYAAYFCLEYGKKPRKINFDLRIYQNDEVYPIDTDPDDISFIIDRIVRLDEMIKEWQMEEV